MGLLGKLLKKKDAEPLPDLPPCTHRVLVPRWDRVEDMGRDDRVTAYQCETCHELLGAEEGRELMSMA
jgi:hypothetical protein